MVIASASNPVKPVRDVEDSLRRRRERGRRSQANFRKRQAEANEHMQDQSHRLKSAIEKLLSVTRGDEHPELLNRIFDVAKAAGIDAKRPIQNTDLQSGSRDVNGNNPFPVPTTEDGEEDIIINAKSRDLVRIESDQEDSWFSSSSISSMSSTQRLTCGIWLDHQHYMRISVPPDDIIPYIGSGSQTFAGDLFWSVMDHAQKKCTRSHPGTTNLIQKALSHSKATENWTITYIYAMIEARQEYRHTGSISARYASAAEPDLSSIARNRIEADYRSRGIDPRRWLSAADIERRVKTMIGSESFAILEAAAKGEGDPCLQESLAVTKCMLAENCICFGDGPRWDVDAVDALFFNLDVR
ncbi:uncharacterized protein F4812DRAFT_19615 [Daldinia caldariorum]|uniref:uncharacterized protein n=1 Tax=Daldinia caldariorum TaxID=326644 RepID=UPI002007461A|nr:uncharacterized protein F4812DRAFT_19615 [Daldinia caldariorum]KAI1472631.1 hypothetical protein F4812DRAFT_19615 [Daldinia caldariorum]